MPRANVNGYDIRYVEQGSGQPMVFLHGNSSCSVAWERQFEEFSGDFRCVAYESVNHGMSANSPRDEDEPDRADELEGFLSALGIERPILVGNSMGGNTALRYGVRHPEGARALVTSGAGVRSGEAAVPAAPKPMDAERLYIPFAPPSPPSSSSSPASTSATPDPQHGDPHRGAAPPERLHRRGTHDAHRPRAGDQEPDAHRHRRPRYRPRGGAVAARCPPGCDVRPGARRTAQRLLRDAREMEPAHQPCLTPLWSVHLAPPTSPDDLWNAVVYSQRRIVSAALVAV